MTVNRDGPVLPRAGGPWGYGAMPSAPLGIPVFPPPPKKKTTRLGKPGAFRTKNPRAGGFPRREKGKKRRRTSDSRLPGSYARPNSFPSGWPVPPRALRAAY